jgi:hypothetical protein
MEVPLKHWGTSTELHAVTSQNTALVIVTGCSVDIRPLADPITAQIAVSKVIITLISTLYTCQSKECYVVFAPHPLTVTLSHLSIHIEIY